MKLQKRSKLEKFFEGFQDILWTIECRFDPEYGAIDVERDDNGRTIFMDALNVGWIEMNYYERRN